MTPERIKRLREAAARHDDSDLSCWGIDECLDEIERLRKVLVRIHHETGICPLCDYYVHDKDCDLR